jgi:predicted nucleic acid-binding protein
VSTLFLLDTSIYSQPLRLHPNQSILKHWQAVGDESLAISSVTHAEVCFGLHLKESKRLWSQFDALLKNRLRVIPFDEECAERFGLLKTLARKKGAHPSDFDLTIASTALVHGLQVVTLDTKDFSFISELTLASW